MFEIDQLEETSVIKLTGELDVDKQYAVHAALLEAAGTHVVLDLTEVTFVDSSFLGLVSRFATNLAQSGRTCALTIARESMVARVFMLVGLHRVLDIDFVETAGL